MKKCKIGTMIMHSDEEWQVFTKNGEPIGGMGRLSKYDNPDDDEDEIVGSAIIWFYRMNEKNDLELLWQKRAGNVHAGYWDISAGGHVNLGETFVEAAVREAEEEIGADIELEDLQFGFALNLKKNRFWWIYFVNWTGKEDSFKFDDGEVSEVKWVKYDELEEFWKNNAKPPLAKDELTFMNTKAWLKTHGYI